MRFGWMCLLGPLSVALGGCSLAFSGDEHRPRDGGASIDAGPDASTDPDDAGVDCSTAAEGTPCGPDEVCAAGSCEDTACGDGIVDDRSEECDDENDVDGDGCTDCELDCDDDDDCDDGGACNGEETCGASGACEAGTPLSEGAACTTGTEDGQCRMVGDALTCVGASCGDGVVDSGEECDDGMNGDDTDGCTDACQYTCEVDADCLDTDVCNGDETCDTSSHTCTSGTALDCDDSVDCTLDGCDPAAGCTHTTDDSMCSDGVDCTDDACTLTGCSFTPVHSRCNDGVGCTDDSCGSGGCVFNPVHSRCDDSVACTDDSCTSSGCRNTTIDSRCNDGVGCTVDSCTPSGCNFAPNDGLCPTTNCTTNRCASGVGCQPVSTLSSCRMVSGVQVFRVPSGSGMNGNGVCSSVGLSCSPVTSSTFSTDNAACLAFHPGAPTQVSSASGFGGGVYCSGTSSGVCAGAVSLCHECTACLAIDCGTSADPAQVTEHFVRCM